MLSHQLSVSGSALPGPRENDRKDNLLAEAIGMNDPAINDTGRLPSFDRRAREVQPMRLYLDDDSVDSSFIRLLRCDGHDVQVPADVGLTGSSDPVHLAYA